MKASKVLQTLAAASFVMALAACGSRSPGDQKTDSSSATNQTSGTASSTTSDNNTVSTAKPKLVSKPDAQAASVAISSTATSPANLEISANQTVTFTSGDGSIHGLVVNGLASVSVAKNLPEFYQFTEPGEYKASDELSSWKVTITVK